MLLHRSITSIALMAGVLTTQAAPTVSDPPCVDQTITCQQSGRTAPKYIMEEAFDHLCRTLDGFDAGLGPRHGYETFEFYESPMAGHIVGAQVGRDGPKQPGCDYKITFERCMYRLPKLYYDDCPTHQGGNVTTDRCGLQWLINPATLSPRDPSNVTTTQIDCDHSKSIEFSRSAPPQAPSTPSNNVKVISAEGIGNVSWATTPRKSLAKRTPQLEYLGAWTKDGCYDSGYKRNTADFMQAVTSFCNHFSYYLLQPDWFLTFTYHMCYDDGLDHKVWISLEVDEDSEPLCVEFSQCYLTFENLIVRDCDLEGDENAWIKQGGWGSNVNGYAVIDGDPDIHNPSEPDVNVDCSNSKAIEAIMAAVPKQQADLHTEYSCPVHVGDRLASEESIDGLDHQQ